MTVASPTHPVTSADRTTSLSSIGGIAALVEAATFVVGIGLFATVLSDYATGDPTPAESVSFLVGHQGALRAWYLVTLIVFGIALVPLALAVHRRIRDAGGLAQTATAFGIVWSGLVLATGMIDNIGLGVVSDLAGTDPAHAAAVWSSLDAVTNGLGGGNELVGGMWVLLISVAGLRTGALPRGVNALGLVSAAAGLVTVVPGLEDVGLVFGLGLIVWFVWIGVVLLRDR